MDVYDVSFFLSTMWVGPFWFAMLFYPDHAMTRKVMSGPIFFIGPIAIWWALMASDLQVLVEFGKDSVEPGRILNSLADLLGTRAGAAAASETNIIQNVVLPMRERRGREQTSLSEILVVRSTDSNELRRRMYVNNTCRS